MSENDRGGKVKRITELSKSLIDQGKVIEGGWRAFELLCVERGAGQAQRNDLRIAFFAGAQHLFGSLLTVMEEGVEPTVNDLRRMDNIADEVKAFAAELERAIRQERKEQMQ